MRFRVMGGMITFMNILFVCSGNTCRSPMAEGLLSAMLKELDISNIYVSSAGLFTSDGIFPSHNAQAAAGEFGADISLQQSRQFNQNIADNADVILCMTRTHKRHILEGFAISSDKVFTVAEYALENDEDIPDPFGGDLETYMKCAEDLMFLLEAISERLISGDSG